MDQATEEYIKYLLDQRIQLELTVVDLKRKINEFSPKETSESEGSEPSP